MNLPIHIFQVTNLLAAVDAVPDPNTTNRYILRVKGEPVDVPPKIAQKLHLRARRWMVRVEWLAEEKNKHYDIPSRIAESGKAWGEDEDPEEMEIRKRKFKEEKAEIVSKKKQKKVVRSEDRREAKEKEKAKGKGKGSAPKSQCQGNHLMRTRSQQEPVASSSRVTLEQIDPILRRVDSAEDWSD